MPYPVQIDLVTSPLVPELARLETPFYVYDFDVLDARATWLKTVFGDLLSPSYAIKSNPNLAVIRRIANTFDQVDASSAHEVERALSCGLKPEQITWSGPGKRQSELTALAGQGVTIVIESEDEIELLADICRDLSKQQPVLLRINPDHVPKGFGASMSGKPSQFGIDQSKVPQAIARIQARSELRLTGFHAYTGSMCLSPEPIAQNIQNLCEIFRQAVTEAGIIPEKLIFGAGFGIPLHDGQETLDIEQVRDQIAPHLRLVADDPVLGQAERVLELGRWVTGPSGALITTVLSAKTSRDLRIAVCDAGFNNHLAACGMMGSVFHKNYPFAVLGRSDSGDEPVDHMLAGPLCTTIDQLSRKISLAPLVRGDMLAVLMSGAYGLTASPTRFISHPEPGEYAMSKGELTDITESRLNNLGSLVSELTA